MGERQPRYTATQIGGGWQLFRFVGLGSALRRIGNRDDWKPEKRFETQGELRSYLDEHGGKVVHWRT